MTTIHVQPTFDLGTRRQKEAESAEIDKDMRRFLAAGGKIQVIGNSALRSTPSLHQVQASRIEARKKGAGK